MPKARNTASPISDDHYLAFIKTIHLSGLGMDDSNCRIDRSGFANAFSEESKAPVEVSGQHEVQNSGPNSFIVLGRYKVSVKGGKGSELMQISCTYSALFSTDKKAKPALVERFAENEVRLVFWPYFRQFVSDSTFRMSINPLLLPLTSET
jgi:preprotein translocase subunit SecB